MEFIYCGKVTIERKESERFKKCLENLRIDIKTEKSQVNFENLTPPSKHKPVENEKLTEDCCPDEQMIEEVNLGEMAARDRLFVDAIHIKEEQSSDYKCESSSDESEKERKPKKRSAASSNTKKIGLKVFDIRMFVKSKEAWKFMKENPYSCPFCDKVVNRKKGRNTHVKFCKENPDRLNSDCPFCQKTLGTPYALKLHISSHHNS